MSENEYLKDCEICKEPTWFNRDTDIRICKDCHNEFKKIGINSIKQSTLNGELKDNVLQAGYDRVLIVDVKVDDDNLLVSTLIPMKYKNPEFIDILQKAVAQLKNDGEYKNGK